MSAVDWFEDAVRPDVVLASLTRCIPDFADGTLVLSGCRVTRIRSEPEAGSWTATYELDVHEVATGLDQTFVVRGMITPPGVPLPLPTDGVSFGAEGWSGVLPELRLHLLAVSVDGALPGLAVVTDPEQAHLLLEAALHDTGVLPGDVRLAGCVPTVVTHKFGVRATVLCRLRYVGDDRSRGPAAVMVKAYHDDQGRHAHEAMRSLSASPLASGEAVGLAQPVAYLPELRLSVQEYVEHQSTLKDLFHAAFATGVHSGSADAWADLMDVTRATATGLAALHLCGSDFGERVTLDAELSTLLRKHDKLAAVTPTLRDRTGSAPARLVAAAAATTPDPLGPAHHSFRPAQVLTDHGRVSFIDFDKFCQAEPAADIAVLTAKLRHMGVNKVGGAGLGAGHDRDARLAELRQAFLDEYRRHAPVSLERVAVWEAMELLSLVLSAVKKVNGDWVDSCQRMLERHLEAYDL